MGISERWLDVPFTLFPGADICGPTRRSSSVLPSVVLAYSAATSPCSSNCESSVICVLFAAED